MKIDAIGDSITEGYPYSRQNSWVEHIAQVLKFEILNQGICGDLTKGMFKRFQRDVLAFTPTHAIILGGTNDAAAGYLLSSVSANYTAMVVMSCQQGIIPVLGLPIPSLLPEEEKSLIEYRSWLKDYANRENILYIDFYSPFLTAVKAGQAARLFIDEVHPSLEGYKLMGETAVYSLERVNASLDGQSSNCEYRNRGENYLVEQILPNLFRIEIPLPKIPLKTINSYVFKGKERHLIIDTGMNREECFNAMISGLAEIGVDLTMTDFVITHYHVDHAGLIARLVAPGCKVYASEQDRKVIIDASGQSTEKYWKSVQDYGAYHGFSPEQLRTAIESHPGFRFMPERAVEITPLAEGDVLSVGGYNLRCIATPGHTVGHISLYEPDWKFFISGDHILGKVTPNISQASDDEDALAVYFSSLDKVYHLEIHQVLPAHKTVLNDCRGRINQLKEHHFSRLEEIWQILKNKSPLNAYEVAARMTWEIKREWDEFPVQQKWFAHGEAIAHIKYLEREGRIVSCGEEENSIRWAVN